MNNEQIIETLKTIESSTGIQKRFFEKYVLNKNLAKEKVNDMQEKYIHLVEAHMELLKNSLLP